MLASALIEGFSPSIGHPGDIKINDQAKERFCKIMSGLERSSPLIQLGEELVQVSERSSLLSNEDASRTPILEALGLRYAVESWIDKRQFPDIGDPLTPNYELLISNPKEGNAVLRLMDASKEIVQSPLFLKDELSRYIQSNSFLSLAWAEVWHYLEHHINARVCPYCGKIFQPPPNNPLKSNCLGRECKKRYEIDRHGGPDGNREYERERKKNLVRRKMKDPKNLKSPGRPKKDTTPIHTK